MADQSKHTQSDLSQLRPSQLRLSKRLTAIAGRVTGAGAGNHERTKGYCLCDVGTDHAHIPIRLLMDGVIDRSIAMDVIEGPLEKARQNIALYGANDRIELRLSDGLDAYRTGESEGLVIAGMGGRIMSRILLREPDKTLDFEEIVLQPQADPEYVRRAVRELGLFIDREEIVLEDNKYYPVMHVVHEEQERPDWSLLGETADEEKTKLCLQAEELFGPVLIRDRDDMLRSYLLWQKGVNDRILYSLGRANDAGSEEIREKKAQVLLREKLIMTALQYFEHK